MLSTYEMRHLANLLRDDAKFAIEDEDFDRALMDLRIAHDFLAEADYFEFEPFHEDE